MLMQLVPLSSQLAFSLGDTILKENMENNRIYILMEGVVSIYSESEFIVQLRRRGDIFGEMSIISGEMSSASVVADTPVELLTILAKDIGEHNLLNIESLENTFFRLSSQILSEKLALTTKKAAQFEIANRQLRETQKELEKANNEALKAIQAKNAFLAIMSHEIRTPLNAIIGNTELLFYKEPTPDQEKYLNTIYRSGELLLSIINNILDFSIIEAGELKIEKRPFDLKTLFHEISEMFALEASRKRIDLQIEYDDTASSHYISDQARIRQIVTNLLSNAVKFTTKGYVRLRLEKTDTDAAGDHLLIHVEDSGVGIPADKQEDIFTEFTLADDSSTRKFGGTGLGLTICKRLIRMLGGEISLDSQEGKGSTFRVRLHLPRNESGAEPK